MDYESLEKSLKNVKNGKVFCLGHTVLRRKIYGVFFNFGSTHSVLIHGAIHAREHKTSDLVCYLIKQADENFESLKGEIPNILFVPMVNPDGVMLCIYGLKSVKNTKFWPFLIKINNKSEDFSLFKANVNGVDLNNNFDADFGLDPRYSSSPSSHGYPSTHFESEPESKTLAKVARTIKPLFTISYHSKGEEIYYNFKIGAKKLKFHRKNAKIFAKSLKYKLIGNCGASCGGFKDYCIDKLKIPSITVEVCSDKLSYPLGKEAYLDLVLRHKNFFKALKKSYNYILKHKDKF